MTSEPVASVLIEFCRRSTRGVRDGAEGHSGVGHSGEGHSGVGHSGVQQLLNDEVLTVRCPPA